MGRKSREIVRLVLCRGVRTFASALEYAFSIKKDATDVTKVIIHLQNFYHLKISTYGDHETFYYRRNAHLDQHSKFMKGTEHH